MVVNYVRKKYEIFVFTNSIEFVKKDVDKLKLSYFSFVYYFILNLYVKQEIRGFDIQKS